MRPSKFASPIATAPLWLAAGIVGSSLSAGAADLSDKARHLEQHALRQAGDADRGRRLFRNEQAARCLICHRVGKEGGYAGPDLSSIGGKFDRPHLIESLLAPSRQIVEGYRTTVVRLRDGRTLTGVVRERSPETLVLLDADGKRHTIAVSAIAARRQSDASLMPDGLEKQLSAQQFTDLIAYLETLRPGGKPKHGAGIRGPIVVPDGFTIEVVATGLDAATAMATLPDGRVLVCEQTGTVRLVAEGRIQKTPLLKLPVDASWERGVIGVAVDPSFPQKPFVYICWVAEAPYPHHRVSRFRLAGNRVDRASERVLLQGDDQTRMGGKVRNGHQGGGLHFGADGCLYIGIGEQTAGEPSQRLDTFLGKILRIRRDGTIPADNPFYEQAAGKYRAVWATGCRNPFTFAVRPRDGLMYINDVGGRFEEINLGRPGANYGWPRVEHGPRKGDGPFDGPVHWYPQASIAGGAFSPSAERAAETGWPSVYADRYFFADFVHGWIRYVDPERPRASHDFATGLRRPVDLRFAADGSLLVLLRNAWVIDDKFVPGTGSLLKITPRASGDK